MIDIHQFSSETLLIAGTVLGLFLGAFIGAIAIALVSANRIRRAHFAGIREIENLFRARALQDLRDNTSARH